MRRKGLFFIRPTVRKCTALQQKWISAHSTKRDHNYDDELDSPPGVGEKLQKHKRAEQCCIEF